MNISRQKETDVVRTAGRENGLKVNILSCVMGGKRGERERGWTEERRKQRGSFVRFDYFTLKSPAVYDYLSLRMCLCMYACMYQGLAADLKK